MIDINTKAINLVRGKKGDIFFIHPVFGTGEVYYNILKYFLEYNCTSLELDPNSFENVTTINISDLSALYADYIKRKHKTERIVIIGYSIGGNIACEITNILEEENFIVNKIFLIDSYPEPMISEHKTEEYFSTAKYLERYFNEDLYAYNTNDLNDLKEVANDSKISNSNFFSKQIIYDFPILEKMHKLEGIKRINTVESLKLSFYTYVNCTVNRDITLFLSRNHKQEHKWSELVNGSLTKLRINANHKDIMEEPFVNTIGQYISKDIYG